MTEPTSDPLDNVVWHSLLGPHRAVAEVEPSGLAVRFDPEVSVFSALPDDAGPDAWAALARLHRPGETVALFGAVPEPPPAWPVVRRFAVGQYLAPPEVCATEGARSGDAVELGVDDVPAMAALVAATEPGPFRPRTIELGTYLGIRRAGRLAAMAGERLRLPGHTELSAICTDDAHRRQGLSVALVRDLLARIGARGETAFLHVDDEKLGAIALYERLGFTRRASLRVIIAEVPPA